MLLPLPLLASSSVADLKKSEKGCVEAVKAISYRYHSTRKAVGVAMLSPYCTADELHARTERMLQTMVQLVLILNFNFSSVPSKCCGEVARMGTALLSDRLSSKGHGSNIQGVSRSAL